MRVERKRQEGEMGCRGKRDEMKKGEQRRRRRRRRK